MKFQRRWDAGTALPLFAQDREQYLLYPRAATVGLASNSAPHASHRETYFVLTLAPKHRLEQNF